MSFSFPCKETIESAIDELGAVITESLDAGLGVVNVESEVNNSSREESSMESVCA